MALLRPGSLIVVSAAALAALILPVTTAHAAEPAAVPTMPTVILVRHAEKVDDISANPAADPVLSAAGIVRAEALAAALKDAGVTNIITTSLQRTILTAKPIAASRRITPQVMTIERNGLKQHIDAVVAAVRAPTLTKNAVVLVVGHSNTVPLIVAALGGPTIPQMCESDYSSMFVLMPDATGGVRLIRSQYGQLAASDSVQQPQGCG